MSEETTMEQTRKIYRYCQMKSMPRNIEMKEFAHADGSITYIGQYYQEKGIAANARPKRVYSVEVYFEHEIWCADISEDNDPLASIRTDKKWSAAYAALGALHGILHKRCVQATPNRRAKKAALLTANRRAKENN